ncbi:unnamed protein product [Mytilus coruscus]|uniref:DDE Tnp4 domain-containing protein n=1 Tax=Mytilus coruscus TaxID=42192 RepID=A0A6J8CFA8_MYTCO|nr:unnamed protein product [Mytilus coruscus]
MLVPMVCKAIPNEFLSPVAIKMAPNQRQRRLLKLILMMNVTQMELIVMALLFTIHMKNAQQILFFMDNKKSRLVPKVSNYYSETIARFNDRDFKSHFRLSKTTCEVLLMKIHETTTSLPHPSRQIDIEKRLLMFSWYIGCPGSTHDAGVLRQTPLYRHAPGVIPPGKHIIGDSAFPLLAWLMKPFRDNGNLSRDQIKFNQALSRSRQVIERSFGFLKSRCRRLIKLDAVDIQVFVETILSGCTLHNICLANDDEMFDIEHAIRDDVQNGPEQVQGNQEGTDIRQTLMERL